MASQDTTADLELLGDLLQEGADDGDEDRNRQESSEVVSPDDMLAHLDTVTILIDGVSDGSEKERSESPRRDLDDQLAQEEGVAPNTPALTTPLATDQDVSVDQTHATQTVLSCMQPNRSIVKFSNGDRGDEVGLTTSGPTTSSPQCHDISQHSGDSRFPEDLIQISMTGELLSSKLFRVGGNKDRSTPSEGDDEQQSKILSTEISSESAPVDLLTEFSPPPAPNPAEKVLFIGDLNPRQSSPKHGSMSERDDTNSDSDDDITCATTEEHPTIQLHSMLNDEDDELEVDFKVAEEIRASLKTGKAIDLAEKGQSSACPLLNVVEQDDDTMKLAAEVMDAHISKLNDISVAFEVQPSSVVLCSTQRDPPVPSDPESSAAMFGIGYRSLQRRQQLHAESMNAPYAIHIGPTFQELDSKLTVNVGASLSHEQVAGASGDEFDDFADLTHESNTTQLRVDAIIERRAVSLHDCDVDLLNELRRTTDEERQRIHASETPDCTTDTSSSTTDNALTVRELHTIYKRGLGDQEVLLLGDSEAANRVASTSESTFDFTIPSSSVTERIFCGQSLATNVITEGDEQDGDEDDDARERRDISPCDRGENAPSIKKEQESPLQDCADNSELHLEAIREEVGQDEWREIQLLLKVSSSPAQLEKLKSMSVSRISYSEAVQYFIENEEVLSNRDRVVVAEKGPTTSCFSCFSRPRLTFADAMDQRDRFFCIAVTSFNPHNDVHVRMLQTIYGTIMNASSDTPLMGRHWETIGFQGTDPTTDLRGCGVLSLLQMLHLVEKNPGLARRFHTLSQHQTRHFPMACALISVTLQCLVALRSGTLYRECNKHNSVFDAANSLHTAITAQLLRELQQTTEEIPIVMKRVLDSGRTHPERMIESNNASEERESFRELPVARASSRKPSAAVSIGSSSHAAIEFTEIGLHSVADD